MHSSVLLASVCSLKCAVSRLLPGLGVVPGCWGLRMNNQKQLIAAMRVNMNCTMYGRNPAVTLENAHVVSVSLGIFFANITVHI